MPIYTCKIRQSDWMGGGGGGGGGGEGGEGGRDDCYTYSNRFVQ